MKILFLCSENIIDLVNFYQNPTISQTLIVYIPFADSSSSLDDSFGSDGQLHERVKDIQILPKTSSPKSSDTLKMKEVELRKSITEKLVSGKTKHATQTITGDTRPGVITNLYLGNCDTILLIL